MSVLELKFDGIEALGARLGKANLNSVKTVVMQNGAELQTKAQQNTKTAFKKGYSHGDTARLTTLEITDGGMTAEVTAGTSYSAYVEHGTRKMEAEPFMKPALDAQAPIFTKDLLKVMK